MLFKERIISEQKRATFLQYQHKGIDTDTDKDKDEDEDDDDFLMPISPLIKLGGLFFVGTVLIMCTLALIIKYPVIVKASAKIRPAGKLRIVQANMDGQLAGNILVKENQTVKKGQKIATIDDSRLQTQKEQTESNIKQSKLQLARINTEIIAQNKQITAENERINRAVTTAEIELIRRQRKYQNQQIIIKAEVKEASAKLMSDKAALEAARVKLNRYQSIGKVGVIPQTLLEEVRLAVVQREQDLQAAQARLQSVKSSLNLSYEDIEIAKQKIAESKASGQAIIATLEKEKEALIKQKIAINKQIKNGEKELKKIEIQIAKTVITAPDDGILFNLNLRNSGQIVRQGEEIAQIAPSNIPLVAKAMVSAQDKNKVKKGQKVQIRVSSCPYPDYGTLKGMVREISPDAISSQANSELGTTVIKNSSESQASSFYAVTIKPESLSFGQSQKQCNIQMGMEGRADIIIDSEETVFKFLLRKARLITDL